jgi:hypothetical protein
MHMVRCVDEFTEDEAKEGFMRICFQNVKIVHIEQIKNNHKILIIHSFI